MSPYADKESGYAQCRYLHPNSMMLLLHSSPLSINFSKAVCTACTHGSFTGGSSIKVGLPTPTLWAALQD